MRFRCHGNKKLTTNINARAEDSDRKQEPETKTMSLIEGWWKKKGKNKLKKDKPKYFILGHEFLDWYNKPVCE